MIIPVLIIGTVFIVNYIYNLYKEELETYDLETKELEEIDLENKNKET
jgi:hypothetical protein